MLPPNTATFCNSQCAIGFSGFRHSELRLTSKVSGVLRAKGTLLGSTSLFFFGLAALGALPAQIWSLGFRV